jgi:hypothetical protein
MAQPASDRWHRRSCGVQLGQPAQRPIRKLRRLGTQLATGTAQSGTQPGGAGIGAARYERKGGNGHRVVPQPSPVGHPGVPAPVDRVQVLPHRYRSPVPVPACPARPLGEPGFSAQSPRTNRGSSLSSEDSSCPSNSARLLASTGWVTGFQLAQRTWVELHEPTQIPKRSAAVGGCRRASGACGARAA